MQSPPPNLEFRERFDSIRFDWIARMPRADGSVVFEKGIGEATIDVRIVDNRRFEDDLYFTVAIERVELLPPLDANALESAPESAAGAVLCPASPFVTRHSQHAAHTKSVALLLLYCIQFAQVSLFCTDTTTLLPSLLSSFHSI